MKTDEKENRCTLLVALEQHFIKSGNHVYTNVQCDSSFWERYLAVFDDLVVCARMREAKPSDDLDRMLLSDHENVRFVGLPEFVGALGPLRNYKTVKKTLGYCMNDADAVLFRVPSPISMLTYPVVKKAGIPFAGEMNMNPRTAYGKGSISNPLWPFIQHFVTKQTKRICLEANGISYVTEHVLQEEYPCKAILEPESNCFTATYSTINLPECNFRRAEWGKSAPSTISLAHVGVMSDVRKGHKIFIDTVAGLKKRGFNVKAYLVGDGPERSTFEEYARAVGVGDCCEFTGWKLGFSEVQETLLKAEFFVFPTKAEGLPRAVIEAMASGLICLGSSVDGMPELIDSGCLSESNQAESYVEMIGGLVGNWDHALEVREAQWIRAHKYELGKLHQERCAFYSHLREEATVASLSEKEAMGYES